MEQHVSKTPHAFQCDIEELATTISDPVRRTVKKAPTWPGVMRQSSGEANIRICDIGRMSARLLAGDLFSDTDRPLVAVMQSYA